VKVGIISDTHKKVGRSEQAISLLKRHGASQIFHAGDIVKLETLKLLELCGLPYIAVIGNNDRKLYDYQDDYNLVEEPYHFDIDGLQVSLMHHPTYIKYDKDIMIYGHTHIFDARYEKNTLILNPGEACARNKPLSECLLLDITPTHYEVTYFSRVIKTDVWIEEKISFKRES
jgi:uncharacterized protein